MPHQKNAGFTIVELIVVIAILSLSLPILFSLFFINLRSRARIVALQQVKSNGDQTLNKMQSLIRQQAREIYSDSSLQNKLCSQPGVEALNPYFADKWGAWFRFYRTADGKIASESSALAAPSGSVNLTDDSVVASGFTITCKRSATFSPPIIKVAFILQHTVGAAIPERSEEQAQLSYSSKIKLRN